MKINDIPELLAPAGDFDCLVSAVNAGADAVYVGGKQFSARAYAKNFDEEEMARAVSYCHTHGVKLYVTLNTLLYEKELPSLAEYAAFLWEIGVDAVIVADLGAIAVIRSRVPELEIHASTQMSVHNTLGADTAGKLGASRVVLARELSYEDIVTVTRDATVTTEVFLHGALCVCTSGQCLMSSLVGGRSGNRGECAQPCRLPYNGGKYPLSLKDLSLAAHIGALIDAGVASLKIEGRMKSREYVYTVTSIYRRLLDERRGARRPEYDRLCRIFSRGGFTDGYFLRSTERGMTGVRSDADKENTRNFEEIPIDAFEPKKLPIKAKMSIKVDKRAELTIYNDEKSVTVFGKIPSAAISSALEYGQVKARLMKLGGTFLSLSENDAELELDPGLNMSPGDINALRRDAVSAFLGIRRAPAVGCAYTPSLARAEEKLRSALFLNPDALSRAYSRAPLAFDYFNVIFLPLFAEHSAPCNGVYLPPVIFDSEMGEVRERLSALSKQVKYALCGNISHIPLALEYGLIPIGDFRLNITNSAARDAYRSLGAHGLLGSCEPPPAALRELSLGATVYGRIPLMLTERCFIKENFGCERCNRASLTDRTGAAFPMLREYRHRNLILNSAVTFMADKQAEISPIAHHHFIFSTESADGVLSVIEAYKKGGRPKDIGAFRRIGKR